MKKALLFGALIFASTHFKAQVSNQDLIAYYPFENNGNNALATGYNLFALGNLSYTSGKLGNAVSFAGDGCFQTSSLASLMNGSFSISYWVNNTASNSGMRTSMELGVSAYVRGNISIGISTQMNIFNSTTGAASTAPNSEWIHYVFTFDSQMQVIRLYKNGISHASIPTNSSSMYTYQDFFMIGSGITSGAVDLTNKPYIGDIDEMYVFNRLLSNIEINALYNLETPQFVCPSGNYTANTQALVDDLATCTSINGNLIISGSAITNLNGLSNIASISGALVISSTSLTDVSGLSNLTSVGSSIDIVSNALLQNIDGLSSVSGGLSNGLTISYNAQLTNIHGLIGITSTGNTLAITDNPLLTNLMGLNSISSVSASDLFFNSLQISNNNGLTSLNGISNLTTLNNAGLEIYNNASLNNVSALGQLNGNSIRDLAITSNPLLTNCALTPFCTRIANNVLGGNTNVSMNNTDCNSTQEVLALCNIPTPIVFPAPYCEVAVSGDLAPMTKVSFADEIYSYPNTYPSGTSAHFDRLGETFTVSNGQTYSIVFEGNTIGASNWSTFVVFIDWNQNEIFETNERYFLNENVSVVGSNGMDMIESIPAFITVPIGALSGITRMRIKKSNNPFDLITACSNITDGAAYDYTVIVQQCPTNPIQVSISGGYCGGLGYYFPDGTFTTSPGTFVFNNQTAVGCDSTTTYTISNYPLPELDIIVSGTTLTPDVTVGQAPFTYNWTGPNGFTSTDEVINNAQEGSYALTITDANGCSRQWYADVEATSILENELSQIKLFPNPANDQVSLINLPKDSRITLKNTLGQVIYIEFSSQTTLTINTEALTNGVYILSVEKKGIQQNQKLVISK